MECVSVQRQQSTSKPVIGDARKRRATAGAVTHRPLGLDDASSPALRLGHHHGPSRTFLPHPLQAKLTINEPGDRFEQEADRVAEQVMRMADATIGLHGPAHHLQRKCGCGGSSSGESCEECAKSPVQLQRHAAPASSGSTTAVPSIVHDVLGSSGGGLDAATRAMMEPRFNHDFSHVRVHTDGRAAESARAMGALAYTVGSHLVFGAGQFSPSTNAGQRLIAHELTHVVQQSGQGAFSLQRQITIGGPLDLNLDLCVTDPFFGKQVCGSDAAKVCSKVNLPGCGAVCKAFGCDKKKEPTANCPPGWRAAGSKDFEGQCCKGTIDSAQDCCPPQRIASLEQRCCGTGEVVSDNRCKKSSDLPTIPRVVCFPPGKLSLLGDKCCFPPEVPKGLGCGIIVTPPPPPPPPREPVVKQVVEIFFKRDRPQAAGAGESLSSTTTPVGLANFNALVQALKKDPTLKVQLVGRASPEADEQYNFDLGARRARLVAAALKDAGVPESQIADPPTSDLRSECQALGSGLQTCGKAGATGDSDRQVLARVFGAPGP